MIGESPRRREDLRFITGRGLYVEDIQLPGMLHVAFLRSPYAHARIAAVRSDQARKIPGVVAVITADEMPELRGAVPDLHEAGTLHNPYCDLNIVPSQIMFPQVVKYVGEHFAAVVATSAYAAADGLEAVEVDYDPLPIVHDWERAMRETSPRVHEGHGNVIAHLAHNIGRVDEAFSNAEIVFGQRLRTQSLKSMALECRGSAATWDEAAQQLIVWSTSQQYYLIQENLSRILGIPRDKIRVVARDIGGGFGLKGMPYPEDVIVPIMAYKLKKPLRWAETRLEHMLSAHHCGEQIHDVRVAARKDGALLALDVKMYKDVGAYNHFEMVTLTNTANHLPTHYKIPNFRIEGWSITTNHAPVTPYRGAGRIEATFTMDRVLDILARKVSLDPLEVRRRNLITKADMPYKSGLIYRDGVPVVYDDTDLESLLNTAIEKSDYHAWRERQAQARQQGRSIGIGISSYVEGGGIGPCEGATVQIDEHGRIKVAVGVNSQGQGHETTMAQICAQHLGASFDDVYVVGGDTSAISIGFGTAASRVLVNTGNAVYLSAKAVREKVQVLARIILDCDEVEIRDSRVFCKYSNRSVSFAELAAKAYRHPAMAKLGGPGLTATEFFYPRTVTWSAGVHVAVLELDRVSGQIRLNDYTIVHDCGVPINPMIVEGQVIGGFAQGLGAAILEEVIYDEEGQVVSGSLMDYALPRASDMPPVSMHHLVFPTSSNPLGVRAIGESGPLSVPAAFASAIEDAIDNGAIIASIPVRMSDILKALRNPERSDSDLQPAADGRASASLEQSAAIPYGAEA
jgi:aerobic carbon-monoxide dehydrogenase large subunit